LENVTQPTSLSKSLYHYFTWSHKNDYVTHLNTEQAWGLWIVCGYSSIGSLHILPLFLNPYKLLIEANSTVNENFVKLTQLEESSIESETATPSLPGQFTWTLVSSGT